MEAYTTSNVYEFCLDWQMQGEARNLTQLKKDFDNLCITYTLFKTIAMKYKWFVKSMEVLNKESYDPLLMHRTKTPPNNSISNLTWNV